jgi:cell shape-determining protein MreD
MRALGLISLALAALTLEGVICHVLHVDSLRPDPVLALVVLLALRPTVSKAVLACLLGLLADGFAGTPLGLLACVYVLLWGLISVVQVFLLPDRPLVQYGLLFGAGLLFFPLLALVSLSAPQPAAPIGHILAWMAPVAVFNLLVAVPVWSVANRILGGAARTPRNALG